MDFEGTIQWEDEERQREERGERGKGAKGKEGGKGGKEEERAREEGDEQMVDAPGDVDDVAVMS